jgi:hypothetical protein
MQHNKLNQLPIIREYNTVHQDFNQLITSIEALLKNGVAHQQIAVVYNEANGGESLFAYFTQNKLAYTCSSDLNLLNLSLSHQIILLLKYIAAEYDMPASGDDVLFQILHFKWFNIPHIAIATLTAEVADKRFSKDKTTLRNHLLHKSNTASNDLFTQPIPGFKLASDFVENCTNNLSNQHLSQLVESILRESGIIKYAMGHAETDWYIAILNSWTDFMNTIAKNNPSFTIIDLVSKIEVMEKERFCIPFVTNLQQPDGVRILSTPDATDTAFDFIFKVESDINHNEPPTLVQDPANFVDRVLGKFVMNVSALNSYLHCPLQFYFNYVVKIPPAKSEAMAFGSAVHYALECLFNKMQTNNSFPSNEVLLEDFNQYMQQHRIDFTKEQFDRKLLHGKNVLTNYYNYYIHEWNKIVVVERMINNVMVNEIPLKGKLDKLEFNGKKVNVVDYKTGNVEKALDKLMPPHEAQPHGGDYWRQAVFYKILVDNYAGGKWQAESSEFDFIEPNQNKTFQKVKLMISPADIATVTHQITDVWNKIQQREFYTGCGKPKCSWCDFVKKNVNLQ